MRSPQSSVRQQRFRPLRAISIATAFLLILGTGAFLAAQQQQYRYERPKCWECAQPSSTPNPKATPELGDWESATNCDRIEERLTAETVLLKCTIKRGESFKVKASKTVSSKTTRQGDFVGFELAQDVRSSVDPIRPFQRGRIVIQKASPAFGVVLERKHRHFPFVNGKLNVSLGAVTAIDGTLVPVYIDRFKCPECLSCLFRHGKTCDAHCNFAQPISGKRSTVCNSDVERQYVSGRADRDVAPVIGAIAATALAFVDKGKDDPTLKAYLLFTLVDQTGIPELLAGTDAEIREGEIFEAYVTSDTSIVIEAKSPVLTNQTRARRH